MKKAILFICLLSICSNCISQEKVPRKVRKFLKRQDEKSRSEFPETIDAYPLNTLGAKLQEEFTVQAENSCSIVRLKPQNGKQRNYIPKEISDRYRTLLRTTGIQGLGMSANNALFFSFKPQDIVKLENGTFSETDYVAAQRVIGLFDNLVDYGHSYPVPIDGFPSYFFQNSCGSYFTGKFKAGATFPTLELQSSMEAETEKKSMITTIAGKFVSPLYLTLTRSGKKSVYTHMLIWDLYAQDERDLVQGATTNDLLINTGEYIAEFDATLIFSSSDRSQNINIAGRIGAGLNSGIFSADGQISSGLENKEKFSMNGFTTLIHKKGTALQYLKRRLPTHEEINKQLQSSLSYPNNGHAIVTHLLPYSLKAVMGGIPTKMCTDNSWKIETYDTNIWAAKPEIKAVPKQSSTNELPDCICEVVGRIKPTAITAALSADRFLKIDVTLSNTQEVAGKKLNIIISDPLVRIVKGPTLSDIDENAVNASAKIASSGTLKNLEYNLQLLIDDVEVPVKNPLDILEFEMEYVNPADKVRNLVLERGALDGKSIKAVLKTPKVNVALPQIGETVVPIKLKMKVRLSDGINTAVLISNPINLRIPEFSETPAPSANQAK